MPDNRFVTDSKNGALIKVHLNPKSSKEDLGGFHADALKVWVKAPAVEGKANLALEKLLAKRLGIPGKRVKIVAGAASRNKTVLAQDLTAKEAEKLLSG